jgi:carbonic anhydrase
VSHENISNKFHHGIFPAFSRRSASDLFFGYDDDHKYKPVNWIMLSPNCGGDRQSPINIGFKFCPRKQGMLMIEKLNEIPSHVVAFNNGHSFGIKFNYSDNQPAQFHSKSLKVPYNIDSIHFHWGSSEHGSEHLLRGIRSAAEAHIVSYNSKYDSILEAVEKPDGLAVLGILYKLQHQAPSRPYLNLVEKVINPHSTYTELDDLHPINDLIIDLSMKFNKKYLAGFEKIQTYQYKGSLTTPRCNENVHWMISTKRVPISPDDLMKLRSLKNPNGRYITTNHRPIQNLHEREVICS